MKGSYRNIEPVDPKLIEHYQQRLDSLTKPQRSLGRLEEFARRYGAIRHPDLDSIESRYLFTFAADHGVSLSGVSLYPREVTGQMVHNFLNGGAAINVLCRHYGIENVVVDMGVDCEFDGEENLVQRKVQRGTRNFLEEPAMTRKEARTCVEVGFELALEHAGRGAGLVGTGEMGIGNTTAASAIFSAVTKFEPKQVTGRGTGIDEARRQHKIEVISEALRLHRPNGTDPWDILSKVGGFEIGAIMGLALGCATRKIPVVVDGFISTAGALLASLECPLVKEYLFFSHCSHETGHREVLDWLGVRPLFDLDLCLGEGTGAAIAMDLIAASVKLMTGMATFEQAQVSRRRQT